MEKPFVNKLVTSISYSNSAPFIWPDCSFLSVQEPKYRTLYGNLYSLISYDVALGGLVVSVLATGPKVRGFDPDRGRWIFKGDKNPGDKKSSVPCRRFTAFSGHFSPKSPDCLPDGKNLCGQWAGHSLQNAHLPTRKPAVCPSPHKGCSAKEQQQQYLTMAILLFMVL